MSQNVASLQVMLQRNHLSATDMINCVFVFIKQTRPQLHGKPGTVALDSCRTTLPEYLRIHTDTKSSPQTMPVNFPIFKAKQHACNQISSLPASKLLSEVFLLS